MNVKMKNRSFETLYIVILGITRAGDYNVLLFAKDFKVRKHRDIYADS